MKKVSQSIVLIITCLWLTTVMAGGAHDHADHEEHATQQTVSRAVYNNKNKEKEHQEHKGEDEHDHHDEAQVVKLSPKMIKQNHIEITRAQSQRIEKMLPIFGKIVPVQNKQIDIYPRFAGIVKSLPYQLGAHVKKGSILATIESNENLQDYTIKAPFSGTLIKQHVNIGKLVKPEQSIYELADLSSVWAELFIYRKDARRVAKGDRVYVSVENETTDKTQSHIDYISPIGNEHTQSIIARATLPNKHHRWIPGLYIDAQIVIKTKKTSVAVKRDAIQTLDGKHVVFVETKPGIFSPKTVTLGMQDEHFVQILSGVQPGMRYVAKNSFILKAELEKSSAEHSH